MSQKNWTEVEAQLYLKTFRRIPLVIVRGEGMRVWDEQGRAYLDFVGGWAVNALGHCHPVLVEAIERQARTLIHTSNQFYTVPQLELAELLVKHSCLDRVFFCNSVVEAAEGAVKLARRYGKLHLDGAYEVITVADSFHGRTLAMTAATAQEKYQQLYTPMPTGFVNVAWNDPQAIRDATTKDTCAVMIEPVQGEAGVRIPDTDYLPQVRRWCDEKGILLILDEVQTGVGRLGTLFGYEQAGVEPDILVLAKGLASGVPIGAFLAKERASAFQPGDHGSTFGGNPLACAAAFAVVGYIIEHDIPGHVKRVGDRFLRLLNDIVRDMPIATAARGRGLLLALVLDKDVADDATLACLRHGLLINRVRPNTLRFMPPLIASDSDIDEAIAILRTVLASA
ncbi:MAG: aspartate aminotransferase family protein [Dehalococcoidia bacterium]|nr:MAG: aspartate aminotransferase family protein [Dehalococcoidia bacterium]